MGAMYEKGQTKRYSRVASFKGGGNKSNEAKGDSERRRISKRAKEGDIDAATDMLMKLREAEMRAPPMNPMVPGMKGMPMMKSGGSVKTKKYVSGGRPMSASERKRAPSKPNPNPPGTPAGRRPKTKRMPGMGKPGMPGQPKTKQMPKPAGRGMVSKNAAGMIANSPKPTKSKPMPRPASRPTTPQKPMPPMARKRGMAAGGDVYTTPGGPARGKSGKIKKMAAGGMAGMIPKAGKKSPNSMGTSYSAGGRVKSSAIDGCAVKGKTRGRTM